MIQKRFFSIIALPIAAAILLAAFYSKEPSMAPISSDKISGVNFVAPSQQINESAFNSIHTINAQWVAITPYAYTPRKSHKVVYYKDHPHWWGEGVEGTISQLTMAKAQGLKIMLKPHVWVVDDGWAGEFSCQTEDEWKEWESSYSKYILTYANICDSMNIDLFCFSTEYCRVVKERTEFWNELIRKIKMEYEGPLTYAANWDNYTNVNFWNQLDIIGIDAYFPLSKEQNPAIADLKEKWHPLIKELAAFSKANEKPILFTEFGYRSCNFATREPWKSQANESVNLIAQKNAYTALFESVWDKDWLKGGFLWKWHSNHLNAGGIENSRFTPQNKPAEKVIQTYYSK